MRKIVCLILISLYLTPLLSQEKTRITSAEITFEFISKKVKGTFSGFSSSSIIDDVTFENSTFEGSVAVKTIKSGNFLRDWSLKSGKYFDADDYPKILFKSTEIKATDNGYNVIGELKIKKTVKKVQMDFSKNGNILTGTITLYTSDYGIHIKKNRDANKVVVTLKFKLK